MAFNHPIILWEKSNVDYQGSANILGFNGAALFHYEWDYGSCSGCDSWEASGADSLNISLEMRGGAVYFDNIDEFEKYLDQVWGNEENAAYQYAGPGYLSPEDRSELVKEAKELLDGAVQPLSN